MNGRGAHVVVALDARFGVHDGRPASHNLTYDRMWKRYLDVFDRVTILGRLFPDEASEGGSVEGPGVCFLALPPYTGPLQFLRRRTALEERLAAVCQAPAAYILRSPGTISALLWRQLRRKGLPYGVEVVGDPHDVFAPGGVRHPLRPVFRQVIPRILRRQCRHAVAAAYVTEHTLQRRYPCPQHMTGYSSVELPPDAFADRPRAPRRADRHARLVFVGDVNQLYKAPHVLIDAVARCVQAGGDVTLTMVGAGRYLPRLRERAQARGIAARVEFTGRLPGGAAVRAVLDRADLFVLPSYTEGLPRAMLEAMARGLPCIGSAVGGFGELLPVTELVPPGDTAGLARRIADVLGNPTWMSEMSARNLDTARRYSKALLQQRRIAFYRFVRERTDERLHRGHAGQPA